MLFNCACSYGISMNSIGTLQRRWEMTELLLWTYMVWGEDCRVHIQGRHEGKQNIS